MKREGVPGNPRAAPPDTAWAMPHFLAKEKKGGLYGVTPPNSACQFYRGDPEIAIFRILRRYARATNTRVVMPNPPPLSGAQRAW